MAEDMLTPDYKALTDRSNIIVFLTQELSNNHERYQKAMHYDLTDRRAYNAIVFLVSS